MILRQYSDVVAPGIAMSRSNIALFVSAGMLAPKKRDHALARRQLYLNYGALSLATQLHRAGLETKLVHGAHENPNEFLDRLASKRLVPSSFPILLSIQSFYALRWAKAFCHALKIFDPLAKIIVGGRWVTSPDPEWLGHQIPEADRIVCGLAEGTINELVGLSQVSTNRGIPNIPLNHQLIENFQQFQPSLEVSRGCGMGCHFCEERSIPLSHLKTPHTLADELALLRDQYGSDDIHPYLQSSYFLPNPRWAEKLREEIDRRNLQIQWRTETRVDSLKTTTVEHLAAAGLKVLDLGLESASPRQILAMGKSRHPDRYLNAASQLLHDCKINNIHVKVNILLYAGETDLTLSESTAWLDAHAHTIKGVSVGPVIVFGPPKQACGVLADLVRQGANPVDSTSANSDGITALHLSKSIDDNEAETISLNLSRRYMNKDDYFDLKKFSYYPRNYVRSNFDADVAISPSDRLPFSL